MKNRYKNAQIKLSVKINSEQLLFNWQLGRELVVLRAEEKWENGVVEQLSLDLQDAFPGVKVFSSLNKNIYIRCEDKAIDKDGSCAGEKDRSISR